MLSDVVSIVIRALLLLLATLVALEAALLLGFTLLPYDLISDMPQYLERIGWKLHADHGAREYPAGQVVQREVTALSGDLYRISCLAPRDAQPMKPYRVSFRRDRHGFRNADPWPDDVDLVVIGDSFTNAALNQTPYWQGLPFSTLGLGMGASGTLEQQRLFEAYGLPRAPETLIVGFFAGNDLRDNEQFAQMLRDGLTWRDLRHQNDEPQEYLVIWNAMQWLVRLTETEQTAPWCHYPYVAATEPPRPIAFYHKFVRTLGMDQLEFRQSEGWQLTRDSLQAMASAMRANDGEVILMYIPTKSELYWKYLDFNAKAWLIGHETRRFGNMPEPAVIDENYQNQRDIMRETAHELGIAFLDLTLPLDEAIRAGLSPYFFADIHWNQLGHDIARNALLDFLNRPALAD